MVSALDKLKKRAAVALPVATESREQEIPLNKIVFDPTQPRTSYHPLDGQLSKSAQDQIDEMAESIKSQGLIESITVQELPDGNFLLVVGETRTRAHLKLGRATIRAKIRNDLTDPGRLLIYRLSENVNRNDLTDDELAHNIRVLIKGSETIQPMTQTQVAGLLSKSEGWISKYVRYGDEENQRLWVASGIADTVEKVYRLSVLPMPIQVDVQRRAALPATDPEHLAKPLNRSVIDELSREVKRSSVKPFTGAMAETTLSTQTHAQPQGQNALHQGTHLGDFGTDRDDAVGAALAQAAQAGQVTRKGATSAPPVAHTAQYTLDPQARAAILNRAASLPSSHGREALASNLAVQIPEPPVNCRMTVQSLGALLHELIKDQDLYNATLRVQVELTVPGQVAGLIANRLTGVVVASSEVPATLHNALAKF